jgi:hypothetical protein
MFILCLIESKARGSREGRQTTRRTSASNTTTLTTNTVSTKTQNGAAERWQLCCEDNLPDMQEAEVVGDGGAPFGLAVSGIPAANGLVRGS